MTGVLTKVEAEQLIDRIPSMRAETFESRMLRELVEHYELSLKSHDGAGLIELTISLYAKSREWSSKRKARRSRRAVSKTGGGAAVRRAFDFLVQTQSLLLVKVWRLRARDGHDK